jgi:large subunit ribosomal protein L23
MKEPVRILVKPMVSEKSEKLKTNHNQYCFEVSPEANKLEIKYAVEKFFDVKNKVLHVRTLNFDGKYRRKRGKGGYRRDWKKAVVTLAKGNTIDFFDKS